MSGAQESAAIIKCNVSATRRVPLCYEFRPARGARNLSGSNSDLLGCHGSVLVEGCGFNCSVPILWL
jgi:hypothetical protein